jgi:cbb3-type cytochrome oxidase subunit 3
MMPYETPAFIPNMAVCLYCAESGLEINNNMIISILTLFFCICFLLGIISLSFFRRKSTKNIDTYKYMLKKGCAYAGGAAYEL